MTNAEAIEILKIERNHMTPTLFTERIEAMDMAISALQAQELSKNSTELGKENGDLQPTCNHLATDTISRQVAIEAVEILLEQTEEDADVKTWNNAIRGAINSIKHHVSSAQPEKRTEERTETHACDCIERQAAIDAILAVTGYSSVRELYEHVQEHGLSDMWSGGVNAAIDIIIAVPPAHPETDVLAWMLAYHTKSFELHGRYFPHEVIGWLVNDFSKDFIAERQKE